MKDKTVKDHLNKYISISAVLHLLIFGISTGITKCSDDEIILPPSAQVDIIAPSDLPTKVNKAPEPIAKEKPLVEEVPPKELPKKEVEPTPEPEGPKVNLEEKKKLEKEKKKELERKKREKEKKLKADKKKKELEKQAKKIKSDQNAALNRLKQKAALDKLTKKEATPNAGKRLNPGTSFSGLDSIQFLKYYGDIKGHLYNNWSLPQWLSELELKAQALVVIDSNGNVIKKKIIKSSGNTNFDDTVLAAIDKASPFPVAPDRLKDKVKNKEIIFGFPEN